jgi:hypothetical protein
MKGSVVNEKIYITNCHPQAELAMIISLISGNQ